MDHELAISIKSFRYGFWVGDDRRLNRVSKKLLKPLFAGPRLSILSPRTSVIAKAGAKLSISNVEPVVPCRAAVSLLALSAAG